MMTELDDCSNNLFLTILYNENLRVLVYRSLLTQQSLTEYLHKQKALRK